MLGVLTKPRLESSTLDLCAGGTNQTSSQIQHEEAYTKFDDTFSVLQAACGDSGQLGKREPDHQHMDARSAQHGPLCTARQVPSLTSSEHCTVDLSVHIYDVI